MRGSVWVLCEMTRAITQAKEWQREKGVYGILNHSNPAAHSTTVDDRNPG